MRPITIEEATFDVPTGVANGDTKLTERFDLDGAGVQIVCTSGTYQLQGTIDGTNWVDIGAALAAPQNTVVVLTNQWRALRIQTDVGGDGVATLMAHEFIW